MMRKITRIACVGGGLIGESWAALFASKGLSVVLQDTNEEALSSARKHLRSILRLLVAGKIISKADAVSAEMNVRTTKDVSEAVGEAQYVQESVFENYKTKRIVFKAIDRYAPPNAIIASSTSALLISKIQRFVERRSRCIVAHPFNPVHLEPLVELVPGRWTSRETINSAYRLMISVGKVPIIVARECPGHVANRLTAAVWREAIDMLMRGVASAEDIDKAVKYGPGLRWAVQGPFLSYHLGGGEGGIEYFLEQLTPSFEARWNTLATWKKLPRRARVKVIQSVRDMETIKHTSLAALNRRRDEQLIQLLRADKHFQNRTKFSN
jgi:3-hydroxypropionate dehydrogenase (NADP+)